MVVHLQFDFSLFPSSLRVLDLSDNDINTLEIGFDAASRSDLVKIDLGMNALDGEFGSDFAHFPQLEEISLRMNNYERVENLFGKLPRSLISMSLADNFLRTIDTVDVENIPENFRSLELSGNRWDCSCDDIDWIKKLNDVRISLDEVYCFSEQFLSLVDNLEHCA